IFLFSEGNAKMKEILGEKGSNLAEMTKLNLPVPPGFTISCQTCIDYFKNPNSFKDTIPEIRNAIVKLENMTGKEFGNSDNPLLLSVRSGAPVSMPGMMDTVLNVGISEKNLKTLIEKTNNERFALDTYRRFIQMYSDVVMGIDSKVFEDVIKRIKKRISINATDKDLKIEHLKELIIEYKEIYKESTGMDFPTSPEMQLMTCIEAVFNSFERPRAKYYRKMHSISDDVGTAVTIQEMVFGNYNDNSMTGVAITRDPSTGEKQNTGEFLINAQGEDVLAGIRTPQKLSEIKKDFPLVCKELTKHMETLERHYKDMQEVEFTVEDRNVYLLQTRNANRSVTAQVKILTDMIQEGLLSKEEALLRVESDKLSQLLYKSIDKNKKCNILANGIGASPGAVTGKIVFEAEDAETWSKDGEKVILVRPEMKPDDIHGLYAAAGMLTVHGGKTSHAAVVARALGKPAVCGASDIFIDLDSKCFYIGFRKLSEGYEITIDGSAGIVATGECHLTQPEVNTEFNELIKYADEIRTLEIRGNADTPEMAENAKNNAAEGIGLCRTEQMYLKDTILKVVLAKSREERISALKKNKPMQKEYFYKIFKTMASLPVTIRLLDPPLYEFLPSPKELKYEIFKLKSLEKLSEKMKRELNSKEQLLSVIQSMSETHPMLGLRGCRMNLKYPEINDIICEAIFESACSLSNEGYEIHPQIMVPLVGFKGEMELARESIRLVANRVMKEKKVKLNYKIGAMIEIPRSALNAANIASSCDFFSFGTNDLTQMTLAFSRDDAEEKFLDTYIEKGIVSKNPFVVLDKKGPGKLIEIAMRDGKKVNPNLETGVCGEHGGDPESIEFFHSIGLDYVSCSPFRIQIAKLAAAKAQIKNPK
ncbi:MAG: pyruvate, phosphate dikinase, partial [Candidatus Lokiarchaeota archaeon]|nr:pyruvate, phosphate dikinase [Candidatus Lokiarchaeota archaeon]